jgi:hypothetical protein
VDEAKERERFERAFGIVYPLHRNGLGDYMNTPTACVWQGWLAAKRAREGWVMTDQTDLRKLLNKMTKPQLVARCEELEDRDTRRHIECSRLRQELELRQDQIRILRAQIDAIDAGFVDALHGFIGDERVRPLIEGLLGT